MWTWWLTRNIEYDVRRIRRLRIKSEKRGSIFADEDIKVFEERTFYGKSLTKKGGGSENGEV
jgi:hypothetical protein